MQLKPDEIEKIHFLVKEIEKHTQPIHDSDMTKVIIFGNSGCGKSSISDSLMQNELQIEFNNDKILLDGHGVFHYYCNDYRQSIEIDNESNLIFCEFPVNYFQLTIGWVIRNIIDSYLIHKMLIESKNIKNKIKVILVTVPDEIIDHRGIPFDNLVKKLESIFPNTKTLIENTALVISQCKEDENENSFVEIMGDLSVKYLDYTDEIYIMETNKWYRYLLSNMNQLFLFPKPSKKDVGKMYQFKRREELIEFLKRDPLVNPEINYISCEESLEMANMLKTMHSNSITKVIQELFKAINTNIHKVQNQDEINKLIESMKVIISKKFNTYEDISQTLREQIQNQQEYETYYQQISEFHEFYSFLDKYISNKDNEMKVTKELRLLASRSLTELQKISKS